ncbi:hypothetical protein EU545_04630 [Candidatus Thorarchaeota archaeon]|nr:MAG: hypothetical protein EU545_04630 [Candidatus Thorarchaeota archaeon]
MLEIAMKKAYYLSLLALLVLVMTALPMADCQQSQGLSWGVTEGEALSWEIVKTSVYTPVYSDDISDRYLYESQDAARTVGTLPGMSSVVDNYTEIPSISGVPFLTDFRVATPEPDILPIGNWSLLEELDRSSFLRRYSSQDTIFKNASYFENTTCWGYSFQYNSSGMYEAEENVSMPCTVHMTKLFSKADGVMVFRHVTLDFFGQTWPTYDFGRIVETAARIPVTPTPSDYLPFLITGGGSVVIAVIVVAVYKFRIAK